MNRKYCFTLDLRRPLGVSPLLFGSVQIIWLLLTLVGDVSFAIQGYGNLEIALVVALIPAYTLAIYEVYRWYKWGWLISPLMNACSTNRMIVLAKPAYRTIFGYMRRETAPSFDVYKIEKGVFELTSRSNGCPNFDSGLIDALCHEMPGYIVYIKHSYPFIISIESKKK